MMPYNTASAKVRKYRESYAAPDRRMTFLPAIMFTLGRIHSEFLRLRHILSHRQTLTTSLGGAPNHAFTFGATPYTSDIIGQL